MGINQLSFDIKSTINIYKFPIRATFPAGVIPRFLKL